MIRKEFQRVIDDAIVLFNFHVIFDSLSKADAIVCLGSYDLRVADRAAELFFEGLADIILVTGAQGNWTKGKFDNTEAELFQSQLLSREVPKESILLEPRATNIGENISYSRELLASRAVERVIFITKPQTQRRVLATVMKSWPSIVNMVTAPQHDIYHQATAAGGIPNLIDEMVGDVERLISYPAMGYQVAVEIPDAVLAAQSRLKRAGFDKHCVD